MAAPGRVQQGSGSTTLPSSHLSRRQIYSRVFLPLTSAGMAVERAHKAAVWPLEAAQWLAVRPSLSLLEPWVEGRKGRAGVARRDSY